jgi:hypothetical protein
MVKDIEPLYFSFEKCLFSSYAHLLLFSFLRSLYIPDIKPLLGEYSVGCLFLLVIVYFAVAEAF